MSAAIPFSDVMRRFDGSGGWRPAIDALRSHLDRTCFHGLYKYLASVSYYPLLPSMFCAANQDFLHQAARIADAYADCPLAGCLAARQPFRVDRLPPEDRDLLAALETLALVHTADGMVTPGQLQLLSVKDNYLLIDAAVHFPLNRVHDIYIGPDTYLILYYLNRPAKGNAARGLDLCSGSGVLALALADACESVVATDISLDALTLMAVNAALNRRADKLSIRKEPLAATLDAPGQFDLITCNPPFVAFPDGIAGTLYAQGPGEDGQDYIRLLLDKLAGKIAPGGEAVLVTDFAGGRDEPFFVGELRDIAGKRGLAIDLYLDSRVLASSQITALVSYVRALHPGSDPGEIREKIEEMVLRKLGASFYYMSTLRVRPGPRPGVRVFNRYCPKPR